MEQFFSFSNTPEYKIILMMISLFSGMITRKTWVILKESKLRVKFTVRCDIESNLTKVLSMICLFIGSIFATLILLTVTIGLFLLINISITWSIISYHTIGNYIPTLIYFSIVGILLEIIISKRKRKFIQG